MRRKNLARTSRTPGRTRAIHYYQVGDRCYFVDLPGYGYAAVPEVVRRGWAPMIEDYLDSSSRLAGVLSLVDGRRSPMDSGWNQPAATSFARSGRPMKKPLRKNGDTGARRMRTT